MTDLVTLQQIIDKVQAASYHRNYRQACIDINEIALNARDSALVGHPSGIAAALDIVLDAAGQHWMVMDYEGPHRPDRDRLGEAIQAVSSIKGALG